jgi:hypothetical protein
METGRTRGNVQCLIILLVSQCKVDLELGPGFVAGQLPFPDLAIVGEDAGAEDELVGDVEHLCWRIWSSSSISEFNCIVDLLVKHFDGLIDIARLLHCLVVAVEIGRGDLCVVGVEMRQHFEGGCAFRNRRMGGKGLRDTRGRRPR